MKNSNINICVHLTSLSNIVIILSFRVLPFSEVIISLNLVFIILYSFPTFVFNS